MVNVDDVVVSSIVMEMVDHDTKHELLSMRRGDRFKYILHS